MLETNEDVKSLTNQTAEELQNCISFRSALNKSNVYKGTSSNPEISSADDADSQTSVVTDSCESWHVEMNKSASIL